MLQIIKYKTEEFAEKIEKFSDHYTEDKALINESYGGQLRLDKLHALEETYNAACEKAYDDFKAACYEEIDKARKKIDASINAEMPANYNDMLRIIEIAGESKQLTEETADSFIDSCAGNYRAMQGVLMLAQRYGVKLNTAFISIDALNGIFRYMHSVVDTVHDMRYRSYNALLVALAMKDTKFDAYDYILDDFIDGVYVLKDSEGFEELHPPLVYNTKTGKYERMSA